MEQLSHTLDQVRRTVNGRTQRAERSEIGQFLTPDAIARFMASMFTPNRRDHIRILDAGAGAGVLFSVLVETLVSEGRRPLSIKVVAYENDQSILPELAQTMARCDAACGQAGVAFHGEIRAEDFYMERIPVTLANGKAISQWVDSGEMLHCLGEKIIATPCPSKKFEINESLLQNKVMDWTIHLWREHDGENFKHGGAGRLSGRFHRQQGDHQESNRDHHHFRL
jgi:hypothetical protein